MVSMTWRMLGHSWFRLLAVLLACAAPFQTIPLTAEQVRVRHMEGLMHGFLALRTLDGERLADREMTQIAEGDRVTSRLIFRFKDGSVHDDTAIFSQQGAFRVLSDSDFLNMLRWVPFFQPKSWDCTVYTLSITISTGT